MRVFLKEAGIYKERLFFFYWAIRCGKAVDRKGRVQDLLLLVLAAGEGKVASLQTLFQELVDGKGDGLARGDTHDAGGDALVEGVETFLPN